MKNIPPLPEGYRLIPNQELKERPLPIDGIFLGVDLEKGGRKWKPSEERGFYVHWINRTEFIYATKEPSQQLNLELV